MEFDVSLTERDIYHFSMYHAYLGGMQGVSSIVIAVLIFTIATITAGTTQFLYTILYFVFSIVFLVYIPVTLKLRAKQQMKSSGILSRPLHYKVDDEGIKVIQDEASAQLGWEQIYKVAATKRNLLIYSNRVHAYIIPRNQIEDNYDEFQRLARKKLAAYRVRMKG
ncbi:MAG: YcxB family protein [Lachnospiraceae bacterium]